MKTIGRILIILTAALLVVGLAYAAGQSSAAQIFAPPERNEAPAAPVTTEGSVGTTSSVEQFDGESHHEGHNEPSIFGIFEMIKNLVIIGVIVALVRFIAKPRRQVLRS